MNAYLFAVGQYWCSGRSAAVLIPSTRSLVMKKSFIALALVLGLSSGLTAVARADDMSSTQSMSAQTAQVPALATENAALQDYRANINPNSNIPITGPYDQSDRYIGPRGTPLPGWGSVNGEGAGDNGG
jgi:hypothetical protein